MNLVSIALICLLGLTKAPDFAGIPTDTIQKPVVLKEVTIQNTNCELQPGIAKYKPNSRQKKAAHNGFELLRLMDIPQLDISPQSSIIKNIQGEEVKVFINMQPATEADLTTLNTQEIKEVEYYLFPSDPRFDGAHYVINIIMIQYTYGGYTKFNGSDGLSGDKTNDLSIGIISKLVNKTTIHDFLVTGFYESSKHFGNNSNSIYRFPNEDIINRNEEITKANLKSYSIQPSFRTIFQSNKITISNQVGLLIKNTPFSDTYGDVTFYHNSYIFDKKYSAKNIMPFWIGNYFFNLPKNFKFNVVTNLSYTNERINDKYSLEGSDVFSNKITEKLIYGKINFNLTKLFTSNQISSLRISYGLLHSKDKYHSISNLSSSRFNLNYASLGIKHVAVFNRLYTSFDAGVIVESNHINTHHQAIWKPYFGSALQYTPNRNNQISLSINYTVNTPTANMKSNSMLQVNEYMWYTGNPALKSINILATSLDYNWKLLQNFNTNFYINYSEAFNRYIPLYKPSDKLHSIVRTYVNNGHYQTCTFGVKGILSLFRNSLQINISPKVLYFNTTGTYDENKTSFYSDVNIVYYLRNFYFSAYYTPRWENIGIDGMCNQYYSFSTLTAGWNNNSWNISLSINNPFRRDWVNRISTFKSQWYEDKTTSFSNNRHQGISLDVSYTFNYGRKIKHDNELQPANAIESTIIK